MGYARHESGRERPVEIETLSPAIYRIETATTSFDQQSFMRVQKLAGELKGGFAYLEVGSYRGGSLLPLLLDPCCEYIASIDKRPDFQPDERARNFHYHDSSTAGMMANLSAHCSAEDLKKLTTFDADVADIPRHKIERPIHVALIDGEHTNVATMSDFLHILPLLAPDAFVLFHDVNLISDAVQIASLALRSRGVAHSLTFLPQVVAVIALGEFIGPAKRAFASVAIDQGPFILRSKQRLREEIAQAVAEGQHVGVA